MTDASTSAIAGIDGALRGRIVSHREALEHVVRSGTRVGSGLGPSEPHTFYADLWRHITTHDLTGVQIRQALFMTPHPLLVGDDLSAEQQAGSDGDDADGPVERVTHWVAQELDDATRLRRLSAHFEDLRRRRISFVSAFMGPATNTVVPDTMAARLLVGDLAGRNRARAGVTSWQPVHFPDATALAFAPDGTARADVFVAVVTPPDARGVCNFGPSNGANGDILPTVLDSDDITLLLYVNGSYPRIAGLDDAPNGVMLSQLEPLARARRLWLVPDDAPVPAMPPGAFSAASPVEERIAELVADHIVAHLDDTAGRALQVGIGGTGAHVVTQLRNSPWRGRLYTEMLDPMSLALLEDGHVDGSHVVIDGMRRSIDGGVVCTFALGERGDGFGDRLAEADVRMAPASVILQPAAFSGGLGINDALGIDFFGQVNVSARDANPYSGVGGSAIIHRGLAHGGVAYLCLPSTHHDASGTRRSSIFCFLPRGTSVSLTSADIMGTTAGARFHLVTEHGVAQINGIDQHELIRRVISVAHPDFRDELSRDAWEQFRVRA